MLCVPICIAMPHSIYTYENHIGSALHFKLCCAARAHSPRKHKQILNLRHDDTVIAAECNDKQRLLLDLYLTVCEPERKNERVSDRLSMKIVSTPVNPMSAVAFANGTCTSTAPFSCLPLIGYHALSLFYSSIQHIFRFLRRIAFCIDGTIISFH